MCSSSSMEPWVINRVTGIPFKDSDPVKLDEVNSTIRPKTVNTQMWNYLIYPAVIATHANIAMFCLVAYSVH